MNNIPQKYQNLLNEFPFLTLVAYGGKEYVGIIQNIDNNLASMYNFDSIKTQEDKQMFLELGNEWWWGTNRMIPINIFLRTDISPYSYALMTMNSKDVRVTIGPCVNLNALSVKEANEYYFKAEQVLMNDAPVLVLWYDEGYRLIQSYVRNFPNNPMQYRDFSEVYLDKLNTKK